MSGQPDIKRNREIMPGKALDMWALEDLSKIMCLDKNISLAMVNTDHTALGTALEVDMVGQAVSTTIVENPFYDSKKKVASE